MESTRTMGAAQTAEWLLRLASALNPQSSLAVVAEVNHLLRKGGHFLGYGTLGMLFARGWYAILRKHGGPVWMALRLKAAATAVSCTFLVACADEIHQRYVPGRGSSFIDVLLDTSGAVLLNLAFLAVMWLRRQAFIAQQRPVRVVGELVAAQTFLFSLRLREAALIGTGQFLRADSRAHTQSNLDLLNRRAA